MLRKEPGKLTKKIEMAGDFFSNQVNTVTPSKCVVDDNSEELEISHFCGGSSFSRLSLPGRSIHQCICLQHTQGKLHTDFHLSSPSKVSFLSVAFWHPADSTFCFCHCCNI